MSADMTLKQVSSPFQLKEIEEIRGDTYNANVTLQYVAMMSDVDLSFLTGDVEMQQEPVAQNDGIMLMAEVDDDVQEEVSKPRSAKYSIAVAWWQLWHSETVINNAVEKNWITEEEAQEIMSM